MDINLLVMGVGNSRLALGVFAEGELVHSQRISHGQRDEWPDAIRQAWDRLGHEGDRAVVAAGVNPAVNSALEEIVHRQTDQTIQWVGEQIDLPIEVRTRNPAQTGVDRVLNVAAAFEQMGKACIVVDAGTAVTVDCCNDAGEFLGGVIAPGVSMMLEALREKTAGIGPVAFSVPSGAVGDSTEAAVSAGIYHAIRGLVKETAESFATLLGAWPEIIATGGDAQILFDGWELIHAIAPDLNLYGIALAYAEHHLKHED
jgi:type III pantothenate kinase